MRQIPPVLKQRLTSAAAAEVSSASIRDVKQYLGGKEQLPPDQKALSFLGKRARIVAKYDEAPVTPTVAAAAKVLTEVKHSLSRDEQKRMHDDMLFRHRSSSHQAYEKEWIDRDNDNDNEAYDDDSEAHEDDADESDHENEDDDASGHAPESTDENEHIDECHRPTSAKRIKLIEKENTPPGTILEVVDPSEPRARSVEKQEKEETAEKWDADSARHQQRSAASDSVRTEYHEPSSAPELKGQLEQCEDDQTAFDPKEWTEETCGRRTYYVAREEDLVRYTHPLTDVDCHAPTPTKRQTDAAVRSSVLTKSVLLKIKGDTNTRATRRISYVSSYELYETGIDIDGRMYPL